MSDVAGTHSDGYLAFGSQVLSIGSLTTIADDISLDFGSNVLTRMNEVGVAVAEVLIELPFTGSATLQLPSAGTAPPAIGATFNVKNTAGTTLPCKVSKVGQKFTQAGETKINIELRKQLVTGI